MEEGGRLQEGRPLPTAIRRVHWRPPSNRTRWLDYLKLKDNFAKALEEIRPDVIHAGPIQRVALLPAMAGARPLISMSWGFDLLQDAHRDAIWKSATRYVFKRSDWFLADCQTVRREALSMGMAEERTTVFPWGVDLNLFHPKRNSAKGRRSGAAQELILVHTRSWEPRYGVDVALQGFWLASQVVPDIRLVMLGGGSQESRVKEFIRQKGLEERIILQGYQENENLAAFYQAADVYLSASHVDGSSVALLESMACGCPALVSDIPSNLEWVQHGQQGWVFRDGDPQDLADQIIHIAGSREMLADAGRMARAKTEKSADWHMNFKKLLDVYEQVYANYGGTARTAE